MPGLLATAVLLALAFARAARLLQDQVALRASLHSQTRYFSALAADSSDAVVVLDRQGGLTHDSAELARLLGEHQPVPAGTKLIDVAVLIDRDEVEALLGRALGTEGSVVAAELGSRVDSDRPRWFSVRMVGLTEDPDVAGVVVTVHEVTDRILAQREIAHNALHDGLPAWPTARCSTTGSTRPCAVPSRSFRRLARRPLRRPGPVQGRQRQPRSRLRRPAAPGDRGALPHRRPDGGHGRPARRRRVRDPARAGAAGR